MYYFIIKHIILQMSAEDKEKILIQIAYYKANPEALRAYVEEKPLRAKMEMEAKNIDKEKLRALSLSIKR